MKRKNVRTGVLLLATALAFCGAQAQKTADQVKIYLNAGHGSWGPNDRPMATISYPNLPATGRPDTCGFYESNTDLWKVLEMGKRLEKLGVKHENIMYSRVQNGPYPYVAGAADSQKYNRPLSEIAAEVEAFGGDMFISVHSNATNEDATMTNYPVYMYRGKTGDPALPQSLDMANAMWNYGWENGIESWSGDYKNNPYVVGDITYMGKDIEERNKYSGITYHGYLGVLRHGTPGILIEGWFHTYQPARHRALNVDFCKQEGIRYARGIANYFGIPADTKGQIMGTVKDMHACLNNPLYHYRPQSDDRYKPLNGAKVTLRKGGKVVGTYTTDGNYNGVFVFYDLEPGNDYTLDVTADGYKALTDEYTKAFAVKANETSFPKLKLEAEGYVPESETYPNYPDPEQPEGTALGQELKFNQEYVDSQISELEGKTVRRVLQRGGNLFVLALDASKKPFVYVIDPAEKKVIKTISTVGTQGAEMALSDISFTADGYLLGCNAGENQFSNDQVEAGGVRGQLRVYKWGIDETSGMPVGRPQQWFTSEKSGNFYHAYVGRTMTYSGSSKSGKLITTAQTTAAGGTVRFLIYYVENGALVSDIRNQSSDYTAPGMGTDYQVTVSPRDDDSFVIDGANIAPVELQIAADASAPRVTGRMIASATAGTGANYFKYAKKAIMAQPVMSANGNAGLKLWDVTSGLNVAKQIKADGVALDNKAAGYVAAVGEVKGLGIDLYVLRDGKLSKLTTADASSAVEETSMGSSAAVNVYPNPTSGLLNIAVAGQNEVKSVEVYGSNGALVLKDAGTQIDLDGLPDGVYFVKVNGGKAVRVVKK